MDIIKTISALVLAGCTVAGCRGGNSPYAIWPFGVHGSSHLLDGHPGFDFEYRLGAPIYAPTDATVSGRMPDQNAPGEREVLQLAVNDYLIDITNVMNVPASVQKGSSRRTRSARRSS